VKFLEKHLEDPVRLRRMKRWFYAGLAAAALSEFAVPRLFHAEPADFWFEDFPAWESVYGLVSCVVIIEVSKLLGKLWLMRRENYYDS
jgi:hypothetical protein